MKPYRGLRRKFGDNRELIVVSAVVISLVVLGLFYFYWKQGECLSKTCEDPSEKPVYLHGGNCICTRTPVP